MTRDEDRSLQAVHRGDGLVRILLLAAVLIGAICLVGLAAEGITALIGGAKSSLSRAFDHISLKPPADPNAGWLYFVGGAYVAAVVAAFSILLILAPREWNYAFIVGIMFACMALPALVAVHLHATAQVTAPGEFGLTAQHKLACGTWLHPRPLATLGWPTGTPCAAALASLSRWALTLMTGAICGPLAVIAYLDSKRRAGSGTG